MKFFPLFIPNNFLNSPKKKQQYSLNYWRKKKFERGVGVDVFNVMYTPVSAKSSQYYMTKAYFWLRIDSTFFWQNKITWSAISAFLLLKGSVHNFKWSSIQRWQYPIHIGTLIGFVWSSIKRYQCFSLKTDNFQCVSLQKSLLLQYIIRIKHF